MNELTTSEIDSMPSATNANECPTTPTAHLQQARAKFEPMLISDERRPRLTCSSVSGEPSIIGYVPTDLKWRLRGISRVLQKNLPAPAAFVSAQCPTDNR